jgi:hypothetical protein
MMSDTVRGGGHIGSNPWIGYRVIWPLASLSVTPESITISLWPVRYTFPKSFIRCLVKKRFIGRLSLVIVHAQPTCSKSVVFQPVRFADLEALLARNGYEVTTREPDLSSLQHIRYSTVASVVAYVAGIGGVIAALAAVLAALAVGR